MTESGKRNRTPVEQARADAEFRVAAERAVAQLAADEQCVEILREIQKRSPEVAFFWREAIEALWSAEGVGP